MRSRPCLAVPPADLTLDQIQFAAVRLALRAVGQLTRQTAAIERTLAPSQIARLACRLTRTRRVDGLVDDLLRDRRILLQEPAQPLVHERLHRACDIGVQLALGLPFELRLRQLHADDDHQTFAHIVAASGSPSRP